MYHRKHKKYFQTAKKEKNWGHFMLPVISGVITVSSCHLMLPVKSEPLGFFSRKLSVAESHYSAFNRELLAVHSSTGWMGNSSLYIQNTSC
jgi:hypothetical protein